MLFSLKREGNPALCNNMNGSGGNYAPWDEPDRERQVSLILVSDDTVFFSTVSAASHKFWCTVLSLTLKYLGIFLETISLTCMFYRNGV